MYLRIVVRILLSVLLLFLLSGCTSTPIYKLDDERLRQQLTGVIYLKLPFVDQIAGTTCGLATLESVIRYWGILVDQKTLLKKFPPKDAVNGYSLRELKGISENLGLHAFVLAGNPGMLRKLVSKGRPLIVALKAKPVMQEGSLLPGISRLLNSILMEREHFVVVAGLDDNRVLVMDPAQGYYFIETRGFNSMWGYMKNASLLIAR